MTPAMQPWFVLTYPRCRTAWMATFLSGAGVPAVHEGWKYCRTAKELRNLLESFEAPVTCNSDCMNLFFLEEILDEFPNAKFIRIDTVVGRVVDSLQQSPYAEQGGTEYVADMLYRYELAWARAAQYAIHPETLRIDHWGPEESAALYHAMTGRSVSPVWVEMMTGLHVEISAEQVRQDIQRAKQGDFAHITAALRRVETWHS